MSNEVIVAITALGGTILGAFLTGIGRFIELGILNKNNNKDKYEGIIRKILGEYFPRINEAFISARDYEVATRDVIKEDNLKKLKQTITYYEKEIKAELPLELIDGMADLNLLIKVTSSYIELGDSRKASAYNEYYKYIEAMLKGLEKKISKETVNNYV